MILSYLVKKICFDCLLKVGAFGIISGLSALDPQEIGANSEFPELFPAVLSKMFLVTVKSSSFYLSLVSQTVIPRPGGQSPHVSSLAFPPLPLSRESPYVICFCSNLLSLFP